MPPWPPAGHRRHSGLATGAASCVGCPALCQRHDRHVDRRPALPARFVGRRPPPLPGRRGVGWGRSATKPSWRRRRSLLRCRRSSRPVDGRRRGVRQQRRVPRRLRMLGGVCAGGFPLTSDPPDGGKVRQPADQVAAHLPDRCWQRRSVAKGWRGPGLLRPGLAGRGHHRRRPRRRRPPHPAHSPQQQHLRAGLLPLPDPTVGQPR
jgi:hypothetical protein